MITVKDFGGADKNQIINIVRRSLGYIDERLIDHGERVAFIADAIAGMDESLDVDREKLLILSLLHDIGAYKTEEIDDMVRFETNNVLNHALYGYVFLRNTTPLGDSAEALLYHHTRYDELMQKDTAHKTAAGLIFLADRIDILLASSEPADFETLRRMAGTVFSPALVELFLDAEKKLDISGRIRDGSFRRVAASKIGQLALSEDEMFGFLKMLVYSIDFRSPFTVTHTANTTALSSALAGLFGLGDDERGDVMLGAFLHDIGKIAIPYAIIESPGRLTDEQMETMRTHAAFSEEILSGVVSDEVCQIAVRHHEKLNGSGYHRGLDAEQLTLPQRIVAVSDILSALIGRRSYKEPFPKEKAVAILKEMCDAGELCSEVCGMALENYDYLTDAIAKADDPVNKLYETITKQYGKLYLKLSKSATSDARE